MKSLKSLLGGSGNTNKRPRFILATVAYTVLVGGALALLLMRNDPLYIPFVVAFAKVVGLVLFGRQTVRRKQRRQGTSHE
jgi:hypothetical protein